MKRISNLILVALAVALAASYLMLLRPANQSLEAAQTQLRQAEQQVQQLRRMLKEAEVGGGEVEELTATLAKLEDAVPEPLDVATLLTTMPEYPSRFGLTSPGSSDRISAKFTNIVEHPDDPQLQYIDFTYDLVGALENYDALFADVAQRKPLTTVVEFSGAQDAGSGLWRTTLTLRIWARNAPTPPTERPQERLEGRRQRTGNYRPVDGRGARPETTMPEGGIETPASGD